MERRANPLTVRITNWQRNESLLCVFYPPAERFGSLTLARDTNGAHPPDKHKEDKQQPPVGERGVGQRVPLSPICFLSTLFSSHDIYFFVISVGHKRERTHYVAHPPDKTARNTISITNNAVLTRCHVPRDESSGTTPDPLRTGAANALEGRLFFIQDIAHPALLNGFTRRELDTSDAITFPLWIRALC